MSSRRRQCKDDRLPRVVATRCIRRGYHRRHRGPVVARINDVLLVAGTASRLASTADVTPPTTSTSAMADDDDDDDNTDGGARGVASAASPRPSRWGRTKSTTPPPDHRPFAPTSTVVLSFPRGPPGRIVPAPPGEVERRSPPREGVGAVVRGRPLPPLALLRLARRRPRPPSASPIFSSAVATASSPRTIASPPPSRHRMFAAMTMTKAHEYRR